MKTLYWIDDIRNPEDTQWKKWIQGRFGEDLSIEWCQNYDEFTHLINMGWMPDIVCFDHDLGKDKDGYDCCTFLVNYCMDLDIDIPKYAIQSSNPVGVDNIRGLLENYHKYWVYNHREVD